MKKGGENMGYLYADKPGVDKPPHLPRPRPR